MLKAISVFTQEIVENIFFRECLTEKLTIINLFLISMLIHISVKPALK